MTTDGADDVWQLLGEPSRRRIISALAERPHAVGELASELPISRPAVSLHLRVLKDAGMVHDDVQGTRHVYRLDPVALAAFRDQLDTFWRRTLASFRDTAADTPGVDDSNQG